MKLPQIIAQLPPPPIDVSMPIQKALSVDGENKVVNCLLCGEYEMTNTSWSKLQKKYNISKNKIYSALKGKRRLGGFQYQQKRKQTVKLKSTTSHTDSGTELKHNKHVITCFYFRQTVQHDITYVTRIFSVQCSFGMGYVTATLHI